MDHTYCIFDVSLIHVGENLNVLLKEERSAAAGVCGFIAQTGVVFSDVSFHVTRKHHLGLMWICSEALWESTAPVEFIGIKGNNQTVWK